MLESPRHEVGPARGLASGQQRTAAHAPFPAASSSTAATLGSFLYANRPCQKRSRDPPRGGAARPAPCGEGAGAGAETELASPTARTWLTPRAARTSALTWTPGCTLDAGLHPLPRMHLCDSSARVPAAIPRGLWCTQRLRAPSAAYPWLRHHSFAGKIPLDL